MANELIQWKDGVLESYADAMHESFVEWLLKMGIKPEHCTSVNMVAWILDTSKDISLANTFIKNLNQYEYERKIIQPKG